MNMSGNDQPHNVLLSATARHHEWSGMGSLSIKTFRGGQALYRTSNGLHRVDAERYLVLNDGQPYHILINSSTPVQSFCVFFDQTFFVDVYRSVALPDAALLDDPTNANTKPPEFVERTYLHDDTISSLLSALQRTPWATEQTDALLRQLGAALIQQHHSHLVAAQSLLAQRATTREELYRRLYLAHDFILASLDRPISLMDIARVACLSPNHLMRTFKQLFHQSPHQFLTQQRLLRAQAELRHTDKPVTEICLSLGFKSLGSFSWLFSRATGLSPQAYRQHHRQ